MSTYCAPQAVQQHIAVLPRLSKASLFPVANPIKNGLSLPFAHGRRWVPLSEIVRLEGVGNYTNIYFLDGSPLLVALSLKVFARRVPVGTFLRSHRKHLLNREHIQHVSATKSQVVMLTGDRIPVARRRVAEIRRECRRTASTYEILVDC